MTAFTRSERVIVFAPAGRDATVAAALLAETAIRSTIVRSVTELVAELSSGVAFVVLTEEALRDADLGGLRAWLREQPDWSDLPFILLTAQGGSVERNPAAARYLRTLGNVTFLERPFHPTTLVSLARSALRARRRQYGARARLELIRLGEQRLRVALSAGQLGAWSLDVALRRLETSALCRAHYGRLEGPFTFEDLVDSIHPDDRDRVSVAMKQSLDGRADYDVEYRCIWPDGQVHWVQARGRIDSASTDGAVTMSGVTLDITARKAAEAALRGSEQRFSAAVEAVRGVLWTNTAAGEMRGEQSGWAKLTGQSFDAYQGYGWAAAIHPDDADATVAAWNEAVAERRPFIFEHRVRLVSGEWGLFAVRAVPAMEADGTVREWVGVHTDITRQRANEQALADLASSLEEKVRLSTADLLASQARLRAIFESSFQHVSELSPDGVLLDVNATALASIARRREAVVGRPYHETPWFAETPGAPAMIREMVTRAARGYAVRQEVTLKLPAGMRNFDFSMRPVKDTSGRVVALVPEMIDLTDRRQAEEQLLHSQKLETIGQLTGGVAHDFNNLLTPIVGSLELLRTKLAGDERAHRWVSAGLQSAERARILVSRLLSFARRQALDAKAVDVPALIAGMKDLIGRSIGPTIEVEVGAEAGLPPAFVDANQLELAILNLCVNARDAMPDGGRLRIAAGCERDVVPFEGALRRDYVSIAVSDTGTGMSPETLARAIEPFFTTKGVGKGTGLGLSMVHGLAGQLGGGLAIESAPGRGTQVKIWLPVAAGAVMAGGLKPKQDFDRPSQAATILVVDDEALVRFTAADMLRSAGYDVVEASSGAEAKRLVQGGLTPAVLVTDQMMPGLKGTELAAQLAAMLPDLSVLIATGYSDLPDLPFPRISKPFAPTQLVERVRMLVEHEPVAVNAGT